MKKLPLPSAPLVLAAALSLSLGCAAQAADPSPEIPFKGIPGRNYYSRAKLGNFSAERGALSISDKHLFEGDHSLLWRYKSGGTLTCKCDVKDRVLFNLSMLATAPDMIGKELKIEFVAGEKVFGFAPFTFYRQNWNRWEFGKERGPICDFQFEGPGAAALKGCGCWIKGTRITAIRITAPKDAAGEIHLGFLYFGPFLCRNPGEDRGMTTPFGYDITEDNQTLIHQVSKPAPVPPTPPELAGLSTIEDRVENSILNDAASTGLAAIPDTKAWFEQIQKKYKILDIQRIPGGGMRGLNVTLNWMGTCDRAGFSKRIYEAEYGYSQLMYAAAICCRKTSDPARKASLRDIYHDLFDFSVYLGGMPNSWFGGDGYMESVFLMRDDLRATHRFTDDLLRSWTSRFGYRRIFNARENDFQREHFFGSHAPAGITLKGEDADYMRITMPGLILYSLLMPEPAERVRDLHALSDWLGNVVLACVPGNTDTFKPDGSMFHHQQFLYGYTKASVFTASRLLYELSQTEFAVKPEHHAFLRNMLLKQHCFSYGNYMPVSLQGKEGFNPKNWDHPLPLGAYCMVALAGTPNEKEPIDREMAAVYRRMVADGDNLFFPTEVQSGADQRFAGLGIEAAPKAQGHWTISYGASAVHRRPDWQLFIKGYSKYFHSREAGVQFKPGNLLGFGLCELRTPAMSVVNADHTVTATTNFGSPGYDWMKLPGATMVQLPMSELKGRGDHSDRTFVGGADDTVGNGVFALDLGGPKTCGLENFSAKKTWFCFGDTVVCLGSGIHDTHAACETDTTLFQNPLWHPEREQTYLGDTHGVTAVPFEKDLSTATWLVDTLSTGYCTFDGQPLRIRRQAQKCRDISDTRDVNGTYEVAWLPHGHAPTGASYRYVMRPMTTPAVMAAFAQEMRERAPLEILRQDDAAHIVRSRADASTGYAIFDAASPLADGELLGVNQPCVAMLRHDHDRLHCAVSDPDLHLPYFPEIHFWGESQPSTLVLTLKGRWQLAESAPKGARATQEEDRTLLQLECRDGLTTTVNLIPRP